MPRSAALSDEVRGDDRLAVARRERVRRPPEERRGERRQDHERAQVRAADERGETGVCDPVGRLEALPAREGGRDVGAVARLEPGCDGARVERALEEVLRVGAELVDCVLRVLAPTTISFHPIRSL